MLFPRPHLRARTLLLASVLLCGPGVARAEEPGATAGGDPTGASVRALIDAGRYAEADAPARALVVRTSERHGESSIETAEALDLLVEALRRAGLAGQTETRALAEKAVALWERLIGPDDVRVTVSLTNLALVLTAHKDAQTAMRLFERVVALRERTLGPEDLSVARALNNLANAKRTQGELSAAEPLYRRALAIREGALGPDHADVARTLNDLANNRYESGDIAEAESFYERAAAIFEKSLGSEHPLLLASLGNLGTVLRLRGDYPGAQEKLEHALAGLEKSVGPDHPKTSVVVYQLANLLWEQGDYVQAKQLYERGLAADERRFGKEHSEVAAWLVNLGSLLSDMGDRDGARATLERALAIRARALGPDHPKLAMTLWTLANVLIDAHAPRAEIEPLLAQALAIQERVLGADHIDVAATETSLAKLALRSGDDARARTALERSVAIFERNLGPDHPFLARPLMDLGRIADRAHEPEHARELFERALAISERRLGAVHPSVATARAALAAHLALAGDVAAALDAALAAEDAARQHVRLTVRRLGERQALLYAATRASGLDLAVRLLLDHPQAAPTRRREVLDSVVRSRVLVLDETAARQRAAATANDPELERLAQDVVACQGRLARIVVLGPNEGPLDRYSKVLEKALRDKERAEEAFASRSLTFRDEERRSAAGLDEVEKALPLSSVLVAFVRYTRDGGAAYAAFVLRAGRAPDLVPLGSADQVEEAVARWRRELQWEAQAPGFAPRRSLDRYDEAATALRRRVWDPLTPLLAGTDMVFVVPDGALHLVNLAALPLDDGRFLLEAGPLLHILSAERDLVGEAQGEAGNGLLLIGAPEFAGGPRRTAAHAFRGATSKCEGFERLRFSPLPAASREIKAISALWTRSAGSASALVLEGADADEATFKERAPGRRLLHLATHGFVLGEACAATAGNPLMRSGLALAGANRRDTAGLNVEDGILTAEEVATLNLLGVEWAVLSACETGLGDVTTSEGVLGLRRAFQIAGARSVITSLWPVDDESTRVWMGRLYRRHLRDRLGTARAVRQAGLDVLEARRARGASVHPYYWAGFLAAGDWR